MSLQVNITVFSTDHDSQVLSLVNSLGSLTDLNNKKAYRI